MISIRRLAVVACLVSLFAARAECEELPTRSPAGDDRADNAPAAKRDAAWLFDTTRVLDVRIEMSQESWDALRTEIRPFAEAFHREVQSSPFHYFRGDITIGDLRVEGVGIRKKGFIGSLDEERPSLKIDFSEYVHQAPIEGVDRLTLNNNKQDVSLASQSVTYGLFARAGLPAPRVSLARVHVNGESLGIYSNVESIRKPFLARVFGDASGPLFEGTLADFFVGRTDRFEAKTLEDEPARAALVALAELLASSDALEGETLERLEKLVDLDAFLRFWALESLIGFWDGYANNQNNYFVYQHPATSRLQWIPWGADAVFQEAPPLPFLPRGPPHSVRAQSALPNRLFHDDALRARYRATLETLLETVWKEDEILAEFDRVAELVGDDVHAVQSRYRDQSQQMRSFIRGRRAVIAGELEKWPVHVVEKPRVPMYMRQVGTASGKFRTEWREKAPENPLKNGEGELSLVLNEKPIVFTKLGVSAEPAQPGPGEDPRSPRPPAIVFTGEREGSSAQLVVGFSTSRAAFAPSGDGSAQVQGILIAGGGFFGMRFVSGTVRFEEAGMEAGAAVVGSCELKIFTMVMPR